LPGPRRSNTGGPPTAAPEDPENALGDMEAALPFVHRTPAGWRIRVKVQPGAAKNELCGLNEGALKIRLRAPAVENKANQALLSFVAELLAIRKSKVILAGGGKSREKKLFVPAEERPYWLGLQQPSNLEDSIMDAHELAIIDKYAGRDEELKTLWHEHQLYEKQLEKLEGKSFRTPAEEKQMRELKKQKLDGKTKLVSILDRYKKLDK
jgi:uncharacterized protein (TIGR00251 family)